MTAVLVTVYLVYNNIGKIKTLMVDALNEFYLPRYVNAVQGACKTAQKTVCPGWALLYPKYRVIHV